ncbi:hypothetical protein HFP57_12865 [Parasphingopyxis algicola]|uniref:hypothetical protein n=1 Tax=Parasphingopyxis algicola TaxID=2026624 RepID=UPI0015A2DCC0|nr:hypothetical protein [Parasphingopyxis algicola]QLC25823.1 hypothetical protein HFP57_12865 [Parasphingopyxis algicola]
MFDDFGSQLESGSPQIVEALRHLVRQSDGQGGDINPHRAAAVQIANAMTFSASIDEYIERHSANHLKADCAKLGIAKVIVEAERGSSIYVDKYSSGGGLPQSAAQSWLTSLLRDVTRGLGVADLKSAFRNLYIINFNYDRCVEHFVFHWLRQVYEVDESEAAEIARTLRIYHPYGSLGNLPYQDGGEKIEYGAQANPTNLVRMAKRIRTYSEARSEDTALDYAQQQISRCTNLVFLGFGFLEQNIKLLTLPEHLSRTTLRFFASTYDIPRPKWELTKERVSTACKVQAPNGVFTDKVDGDCEAFWREYGENLTQ